MSTRRLLIAVCTALAALGLIAPTQTLAGAPSADPSAQVQAPASGGVSVQAPVAAQPSKSALVAPQAPTAGTTTTALHAANTQHASVVLPPNDTRNAPVVLVTADIAHTTTSLAPPPVPSLATFEAVAAAAAAAAAPAAAAAAAAPAAVPVSAAAPSTSSPVPVAAANAVSQGPSAGTTVLLNNAPKGPYSVQAPKGPYSSAQAPKGPYVAQAPAGGYGAAQAPAYVAAAVPVTGYSAAQVAPAAQGGQASTPAQLSSTPYLPNTGTGGLLGRVAAQPQSAPAQDFGILAGLALALLLGFAAGLSRRAGRDCKWQRGASPPPSQPRRAAPGGGATTA